MSTCIIFDTNYLRTLSTKEYVEGKIPEKLKDQIKIALDRGDMVILPRTVQIEINNWVNEIAKNETAKIKETINYLNGKGYHVKPETVKEIGEIDVLAILQREFPALQLLEPSIDDYFEAEKRTSRRIPPLPKNATGEEFRDRIIWCQAVGISKKLEIPVVIVSDDTLFENGANSHEGRSLGIEVAKNEVDLDQRLDKRSINIQNVIENLLLFQTSLEEKNINLSVSSIKRIDNYRSINQLNGVKIKRFSLITEGVDALPHQVDAEILYRGSFPLALSLAWDNDKIEVGRKLSQEDEIQIFTEQQIDLVKRQRLDSELRMILGG